MKRYVVKIGYLGADFYGSQIQPHYKTVEGDVLENLRIVTKLDREELDLRFSSRTDRGVNALGNAIAFHSDMSGMTLMKALNSVSESIFYRSFCEVDEGFVVRHASRRTYRYVLPSEGLDAGLVRQCGKLFEGEHDFIRFCRPEGKETVLTVDSVTVEEGDGTLVLEFSARYFLMHMIRRMVAAMRDVGSGHSTLEDVRRALDGEDMTFGNSRPDALTLVDVGYDWLTFTDAAPKHFEDRRQDGIFEGELRKAFYRSL